MKREQAEQKLQQLFGLERFFDNQWITIEKLFRGERVLLIEKTGYGKSLCFQFPATQFAGLTIVFSPLIALMREQVLKLQELGIAADYLTHQKSLSENKEIILRATKGRLKILYIHPARMENIDWLNHVQRKNLKISMIVVDEAHCISTWGHDFIPSYQKIVKLVNLLPTDFPVLATTATATPRVENDIKAQIGKQISSIRGNLLRENLNLFVIRVDSEDAKMIWLADNIKKIDGTGIIYTGTRSDTEIYAKWLVYNNINAVHYNASVDTETKKLIETGLMNNDYKCVVSTNALGMGIDKPDIRFIIHTQVTVSPIHYYQEIGRAGRDGKQSFVILFYNPFSDMDLPLNFIETAKPRTAVYKKAIEIIKENRPSFNELLSLLNIKQTDARTIISDLLEQKIIVEIIEGRVKVYEYVFGAPKFNNDFVKELHDNKMREFNTILNYIDSAECRMNFLCNYLGDSRDEKCRVCDNCRNRKVAVNITDEWAYKIDDFKRNFFPKIICDAVEPFFIDGVAASYYGFSDVGKTIHKCKYESSEYFPQWLVDITVKAYNKSFCDEKFDCILYVPPTISGDLVRNFAERVAREIQLPVLYSLKKRRSSQPQKIFKSGILKKQNLINLFEISNSKEIIGKSVLLIDDIYDSGQTMKTIARLLHNNGAAKIAPLVIAKTVSGDKI